MALHTCFAKLSTTLLAPLPSASQQRLQLQLPSPQEDIWVLAHADLLSQALGNLVSNALKYSQADVYVYAQTQGEMLELCVRDYGAGVPAQALHQLTTPFFRLRNHQTKGLGLGLALSEHIVHSLAGSLHFCNQDDGFIASIRLPRYYASDKLQNAELSQVPK